MANIKNKISFDEYNAIINKVVSDCFPGDAYSPAYYEISLRTAVLLAFAPDFELSNCTDNNALFEKVYSEDADKIFSTLKADCPQYNAVVGAVNNAIEFRKSVISSGGMSMSDLALASLLDRVTSIVEKIYNKIDIDSIKQFMEVMNNMQGNFTAENVVSALTDNGLIGKSDKKNIE